MKRQFLAVYVDLENLPKDLGLNKLMEELVLRADERANGDSEAVFAVKLACGDTEAIRHLRYPLLQHNFDIRETPHLSRENKKNRADLILSIEAFESLYIDDPEIELYVFITSDSDFTVVMDKLRKYGKQVWLVTRQQDSTRPIFNNSCDEILVLDHFRAEKQEVVRPKERYKDRGESELSPEMKALRIMKRVADSLDPDRWYVNAVIGHRFHALDKSFDLKTTRFGGINNLVEYLAENGVLEKSASSKGHPQARVNDISRFSKLPHKQV